MILCACARSFPDAVTGRCFRCGRRYRPAPLPEQVWRGELLSPNRPPVDPTKDADADPLDPMGLGPPEIGDTIFIPTVLAVRTDPIQAYRHLCELIRGEWASLTVEQRQWYLDSLITAYNAMEPAERAQVDPPEPPAL